MRKITYFFITLSVLMPTMNYRMLLGWTFSGFSPPAITSPVQTGKDFTNKDLQNKNFQKAALRNANFSGADLRGADLRGADLRDANLTNAKLQNVKIGCIMTQVNKKVRVGSSRWGLPTWVWRTVTKKTCTNLKGAKGLTQQQKNLFKSQGAIVD